MIIKEHEVNRIYKLYFGLLRYTNEKYHVNEEIVIGGYDMVDEEKASEIADVLWSNDNLIDEYISIAYGDLDSSDISILNSWKHHISGHFVLMEYTGDKAVFIFVAGSESYAFGVSGIANEIEEMIPATELPVYIKTTLLPFKDRVIYDTVISSFQIQFGDGMLQMVHESYDAAKKKNGIISNSKEFISVSKKIKEMERDIDDEFVHVDPDEVRAEAAALIPGDIDDFDMRMDALEFEGEDIWDEDEYEHDYDYGYKHGYPGGVPSNVVDRFDDFTRRKLPNKTPKHDLHGLLNDYTVPRLKYIAKGFRIKSSGLKKAELVESIFNVVNDEDLIGRHLARRGDDVTELLEKTIRDGMSILSGRDAYETYRMIVDDEFLFGIYGCNGSLIIVVPDEIRDIYEKISTPEFHERRKRYINVGLYTEALLNLYGVISNIDFIKIYNRQNEDNISVDELKAILMMRMMNFDTMYFSWRDYICSPLLVEDYDDLDDFDDDDMDDPDDFDDDDPDDFDDLEDDEFDDDDLDDFDDLEDDEFDDDDLDDFDDLEDDEFDDDDLDDFDDMDEDNECIEYIEHIIERHQRIPMCELSRNELLPYAEHKYYEKFKENKILYAFLKAHLPEDENHPVLALLAIRDWNEMIQFSVEPSMMLEMFAEYGFDFDIETVNRILVLMMDVQNNTRLWANNGWTPQELFDKRAHRTEKKKKIGRNDPCPCGSGKKYKQCCGKPDHLKLLN